MGKKLPNAWGLYDMLGNMNEWVQDRYGAYPGGSVMDPAEPASGSARAHRGGCWDHNARSCRAPFRLDDPPGIRYSHHGLRLLRTE